MKIAVFSESPVDEKVLRKLAEGILGNEVEFVDVPNHLRSRGSGFHTDLDTVILSLYYNSEAEYLIAVCDSDDTPVHFEDHDQISHPDQYLCRVCGVKQRVDSVLGSLRPLQHKFGFDVAVGIAVPCIEGWLLFDRNERRGESFFRQRQADFGKRLYDVRQNLKLELYGTPVASTEIKTKVGVEEAERIISIIDDVTAAFPFGLGSFVERVRSWKSET